MSIPYGDIRNALISIAQRAGVFETVMGHEAKSSPGKGLHCEVWYEGKTRSTRSGLNSTSAVVRWSVRLLCNMKREPEDTIDIDLLDAADLVYSEIHGNYTLDIQGVRCVDLQGSDGEPLQDRAAYITIDGVLYRTIIIIVPVIVNDAWSQAA